MKRILFVNGSPNRQGHTAAMAKRLLAGREYETLNLIDYKIYPLGQSFADDQFEVVIQKMLEADVLVMGSPVYWHSMTGQFRPCSTVSMTLRGSIGWEGKTCIFFFRERLLLLPCSRRAIIPCAFSAVCSACNIGGWPPAWERPKN